MGMKLVIVSTIGCDYFPCGFVTILHECLYFSLNVNLRVFGFLLAQLCRIMSYRKYAYDLERAKKNKMKEMGVVSMKKSKGMRFTDRIGKGDIDTKVRVGI